MPRSMLDHVTGFYDAHILPRLIASGMGIEPIALQRAKIVPLAEGRVLEIGFGAGHNLPFYDPRRVSRLWALEPATAMRRWSAPRVAASPIPVTFLDLPGEQIPLEDAAADTIVITYTMCSIPDVLAALGQMRRVLKPYGRMLFAEHGEAPDAGVRRWQQRITPVFKRFTGGCHPDRPIARLIADAGFAMEKLETMYLPGVPRILGFNYWGSATPQ